MIEADLVIVGALAVGALIGYTTRYLQSMPGRRRLRKAEMLLDVHGLRNRNTSD